MKATSHPLSLSLSLSLSLWICYCYGDCLWRANFIFTEVAKATRNLSILVEKFWEGEKMLTGSWEEWWGLSPFPSLEIIFFILINFSSNSFQFVYSNKQLKLSGGKLGRRKDFFNMSRSGNIGGQYFCIWFDPFKAQMPRKVPVQRGKRERKKWVDWLWSNHDF